MRTYDFPHPGYPHKNWLSFVWRRKKEGLPLHFFFCEGRFLVPISTRVTQLVSWDNLSRRTFSSTTNPFFLARMRVWP